MQPTNEASSFVAGQYLLVSAVGIQHTLQLQLAHPSNPPLPSLQAPFPNPAYACLHRYCWWQLQAYGTSSGLQQPPSLIT
jgi:hypothetical protein